MGTTVLATIRLFYMGDQSKNDQRCNNLHKRSLKLSKLNPVTRYIIGELDEVHI